MSNYEVVDAWLKGEAGHSNNLMAARGRLYSYGEMIAKVCSPERKQFLLYSTASDSETVIRHRRLAYRIAVSRGWKEVLSE